VTCIEEAYNPGYGETLPVRFRQWDGDPMLSWAESKMFWDGGSNNVPGFSKCSSVAQWVKNGIPAPINPNSLILSALAGHDYDDILAITKTVAPIEDLIFFLTRPQYNGRTCVHGTDDVLDIEDEETYTLDFYMWLNGQTSCTINFFSGTAAATTTNYGVTAATTTQSISLDDDTIYKWQKVTATFTVASSATLYYGVPITIKDLDHSGNSPLALISNISLIRST